MLQRLRNLWKLSEFEPFTYKEPLTQDDQVLRALVKRPKMAQIIKRKDPIDEILDDTN